MNNYKYDELPENLGTMLERLRNLVENDYIAAYYKDHILEGLTIDEVKEEISRLSNDIEVIENQLNEFEW